METSLASDLARRLGPEKYQERLDVEANPRVQEGRVARHSIWLERLLKVAGVLKRGRRNALDFAIEQLTWAVPVPRPFTLLQLTDLHFLPDHPLCDAIEQSLESLHWDACVLTGDYRFPIHGDIQPAVDGLLRLREMIPGPLYAILGNHDSIEMVEPAEAAGLPFLLNESVLLEPGIALIGVDDPAYFLTDDLDHAMQDVPADAAKIMLAHSCRNRAAAAEAGVHLQLSGHSHGGQICLPGGFPVIHNLKAPRHMNRGPFRDGDMHGYVSRGTGSCGVDVRFYCPPEITLHHLVPA